MLSCGEAGGTARCAGSCGVAIVSAFAIDVLFGGCGCTAGLNGAGSGCLGSGAAVWVGAGVGGDVLTGGAGVDGDVLTGGACPGAVIGAGMAGGPKSVATEPVGANGTGAA